MNNDADPEDLKHAFDAPVVIVARSIESRFVFIFLMLTKKTLRNNFVFNKTIFPQKYKDFQACMWYVNCH